MSKFAEEDVRREVAGRLRGGYDVTGHADGLHWLNGTLFGLGICARSEEEVREGIARLADLIEPGAPGRPGAAAKEARHGCDIDALLALADEMEKHACGSDVVVAGMSFVNVNRLDEYARRIREACGEVGA